MAEPASKHPDRRDRRHRARATLVVVEFALVALLVVYLVPWIFAVAREHERHAAILAATLLTGWTGVGWLAALWWAVHSDPRPSARPRTKLELIEGRGALHHRDGRGALRPVEPQR